LGRLRLFCAKGLSFFAGGREKLAAIRENVSRQFFKRGSGAYIGEKSKRNLRRGTVRKEKNEEKRGFREEARGETRQRKKIFQENSNGKNKGQKNFLKEAFEKSRRQGQGTLPQGT